MPSFITTHEHFSIARLLTENQDVGMRACFVANLSKHSKNDIKQEDVADSPCKKIYLQYAQFRYVKVEADLVDILFLGTENVTVASKASITDSSQ